MAIPPGTANDDTIPGTVEADEIEGRGGNDSLSGFEGDDTLYGGSGNDTLEGGTGTDSLLGGSGNDLLTLGAFGAGSSGSATGGSGDDTLRAFDGLTTLAGGDGIDVLSLVWGNAGLAGNVQIDLSAPDGVATSASGSEASFSGIERLDLLLAGGTHSVVGGALDDRIWLLEHGLHTVDGGAGNDDFFYRIGRAVTLSGGDGQDTLRSETVSDSTTYFIVDGGDGSVDDGQLAQITGFEVFDVQTGTADAIVSLGDGNDTIHALQGNDTLFGMGGRDRIYGSGGSDTVNGGHGADRLNGGSGSDTVQGGAGNDLIFASAGNDTLLGGGGADRFVFTNIDNGFDLIGDFAGGEDQVRLTAASLGVLAPPTGVVGASRLQDGGPVGTDAQFVTLYQADSDETVVLYYDKGTATSGAFALFRLAGQVTLAEGDLWLL